MAIYAISDLHLSFGVDKPMNIFGKLWDKYEEKIKQDWNSKVLDQDIVIIPGDISWGINLSESLEDFKFINSLPGKKIILRGNHDYYFSTKTKLENFFKENGIDTIEILHNNVIELDNYILCGTRGWDKEEKNTSDEDKKIILREEARLKLSLDAGKKLQEELKKTGITKEIIVAMHFPPYDSNFHNIMLDYNVKMCIYGHLHGYGHMQIKEGNIDGINYKMVSCDYTEFKLVKID